MSEIGWHIVKFDRRAVNGGTYSAEIVFKTKYDADKAAEYISKNDGSAFHINVEPYSVLVHTYDKWIKRFESDIKERKLAKLRRDLSSAGDYRDWYACNRIENEINELLGNNEPRLPEGEWEENE
nr:hypothetical protein 3 [bacterium]